jgi:hypothetical protein
MTEKVSEKKVIGRNVAIALGIICIILAVGLVVADSQISSLNDTVNLAKSTIWVNSQTVSQSAGSYTKWTFSASYAGYVEVDVESATVNNTYVEMSWYYIYGIAYDKTVNGSTRTLFPVLPTVSIQIDVGNRNLINGTTEMVTITYYY